MLHLYAPIAGEPVAIAAVVFVARSATGQRARCNSSTDCGRISSDAGDLRFGVMRAGGRAPAPAWMVSLS